MAAKKVKMFKLLKMMRLLLLFALLGSSLAIRIDQQCRVKESQRIVTTQKGKVIGEILTNAVDVENSYTAFKGIPYGKSQRFKQAETSDPWKYCLVATAHGSQCMQVDPSSSSEVGSEDCHFLNVYSPKKNFNTNSEALAVMVYIHGGIFLRGNGDSENFGPELMMKENVVLVTFNYRLGAFGFLNLHHKDAAGNMALKDQVLALKWVQENIANFGGDPGKVTIMGQSAGAVMVDLHLISPMSRGLFHRSIAMSGSAYNVWAFHSRAEAAINAKEMAAKIQITNPIKDYDLQSDSYHSAEDSLEILQSANAKQIARLTHWSLKGMSIPFAPSEEDPTLSKDSFLSGCYHQKFRSGHFQKLPHMMGFTDLESWGFRSNFPNFVSGAMDRLKGYGAQSTHHFLSDQFFASGIDAKHRVMSKNRVPIFYYYFKYDPHSNNIKGAGHSEDLAYLFFQPNETLFDNAFYAKICKGPQYCPGKVIQTMVKFWTNFAKHGDPSSQGQTWSLSTQNGGYMMIDGGSQMYTGRALNAGAQENVEEQLRQLDSGKCCLTKGDLLRKWTNDKLQSFYKTSIDVLKSYIGQFFP